MTKYVVFGIILVLAAVVVLAQNTAQSTARKAAAHDTTAPSKVTGDGVRTPSGLVYWEIRVGTGAAAKEGSRVRVH